MGLSAIGAFDNDLMFFTNVAQTDSVSSAAIKVRGFPIRGMSARILIPTATDTTTTIMPRFWVSGDDSTYYLSSQWPGAFTYPTTEAQEVALAIDGSNLDDAKYVKLELLVVGSTGVFGTVIAGLVTKQGGQTDNKSDFS